MHMQVHIYIIMVMVMVLILILNTMVCQKRGKDMSFSPSPLFFPLFFLPISSWRPPASPPPPTDLKNQILT